MANVTLYLPAEIESRAREKAKKQRLSLSRWVAREIARSVDDEWPPEFLQLAGACPDFPGADALRTGYGKDAPRKRLR